MIPKSLGSVSIADAWGALATRTPFLDDVYGSVCWGTHMLDLRGKKVCITGGSSGIGFEVTKELLSKGAHVYSIARRPSVLKDPRLRQYQIDVSSALPSTGCVEFDVLILNMGYNIEDVAPDSLTHEGAAHAAHLNMMGHLRFINEYAHKRLVFINTVMPMVGNQGYTLYCVSKSYVSAYNETLRREGRNTYIVCPYNTKTLVFDEMKYMCSVEKIYLAKIIVGDIVSGESYRSIPLVFKFIPILRALLPAFIADIVAKILLVLIFKQL